MVKYYAFDCLKLFFKACKICVIIVSLKLIKFLESVESQIRSSTTPTRNGQLDPLKMQQPASF